MFSLLWFKGVGWNTSMREIGWVYVVIAVLILAILYMLVQLIKMSRDEFK